MCKSASWQPLDDKEYVILEQDGIPIAAFMDVDEFEDYLEIQDSEVKRSIEESREEYLAGKGRPAEEQGNRMAQRYSSSFMLPWRISSR